MYKLGGCTKEDYPVLLDIWEQSVRATHHFLDPTDIDFFRQVILEKEIFGHVDITVVKDENDSILGFLGVSADSIEMLFLHPTVMGKGIGKMLMNFAIEKLNKRKVDVNEQNTSAVQFYKSFGFKVISRSAVDGTGKPYPILHLQKID